jgi:mRNA interferase MazF
VGVVVKRFDVFRVILDPTIGSEIRKTRPCVVVSPDELNRHIRTVIIAPMTTKGISYATRVPCKFKGKRGQIALDQLRAVDKSRLSSRLGTITVPTQEKVLAVLSEIFAR